MLVAIRRWPLIQILYFHSMVRKPVVNLDAILSCQFLRPLGIGLSLGEESP